MIKQCPRFNCRSLRVVCVGYSNPVSSLGGLRRQRYLCLSCGRKYNNNFNHFNFAFKKSDQALSSKIFQLHQHSLSNRAIARVCRISEGCVRLRLERMARQAFCFHHKISGALTITEPICMDGLENFAISQYNPNNIQQAIGHESLFVYDFNYAPLNRKGRMSDWQKGRLAEIENDEGRYNPSAIRNHTKVLLQRLYNRSPIGDFRLLTDEHFHYRRAIKEDMSEYTINHDTVNSKECRNFQNILFPVNHADLMIRHQIKAFTRETIAFSKTPASMCQKYMLYAIYKNYMSPQFTKRHVKRPKAHEQSPAQHLGLTNRILSFGEVFEQRVLKEDIKELNQEWQCYVQNKMPPETQRHKKYVRKAS